MTHHPNTPASRTGQAAPSVASGEATSACEQEATRDLVNRFAQALLEKLAAAEKKYGYTDGWLQSDWMDECRAKLMEHVAKGDPRDVAAYCAFLWHHGESTSALSMGNGWPQYIAGIIETYIQQDRTDEDRETGIAKIIERRLYSLDVPVEPAGVVADDSALLAWGERHRIGADVKRLRWAYEDAISLAGPGAAIAAHELTPSEQIERIVHLRIDRARRVYIAGPMTGLPEYNFPLFNAVAANLRAAGWHVENPAEHGHIDGAGWADYLRWDISRIATCGSIWLLPGWTKSKGAMLEVHIARTLGMKIEFGEGAELEEAPGPGAEDYPPLPVPEATIRDFGDVYQASHMRAYVDVDRRDRKLSACNFCLSQAAEARAALASRQEAPATSAQPMFFASPEQANALQDRPDDTKGGVYLPLRKTVAGKFTMPLYAAPTAARSPGTVAQPVRWEDSAEKYLAEIISRAPEPLRELGDWLAAHLDEDDWKTAERYVLGAMKSAAQPCPYQGCGGDGGEATQALIEWVASRWHAEVANRPLVNVHRRSLDDSWRQILRHLGVDDRARLGPTHDELAAHSSGKSDGGGS